MASLDNLAIPKGSKVLVTGANGYLGSHIADQFLQRGFKVRGAVRDVSKNSWLVELLEKRYGKNSFELDSVVDLNDPKAYDEVAKGVSAIVHTAAVMNFDPNPNNVIPQGIAGAISALKAAYNERPVKRFVLTSSSVASVSRAVGKPYVTVDEESWNEDDIKAAWADPPYGPERSYSVYAAGKAQTEKEVWNFRKENSHKRPDLVVNAILPDLNFGAALDPKHQGTPSSSAFIPALWNGQVTPGHRMLPPQHYINVQDAARLHVAATIFPHVQSQRIFGFVAPFNWDLVLDILQKRDPGRKLPPHFSGEVDATNVKPSDQSEQLLRDLGQPGWISLELSIESNLEGIDDR